jgi:GxxExxY protein
MPDVAIIEGELAHRIIGACMKVHRVLGPGLLEKVYENALVIELRSMGLQVDQQWKIDIPYEGQIVGTYTPDVFVEKRVIVDTKTIKAIGDEERAKMIHYVRIAKCALGLIVNFANASLESERILHPNARAIYERSREK